MTCVCKGKPEFVQQQTLAKYAGEERVASEIVFLEAGSQLDHLDDSIVLTGEEELGVCQDVFYNPTAPTASPCSHTLKFTSSDQTQNRWVAGKQALDEQLDRKVKEGSVDLAFSGSFVGIPGRLREDQSLQLNGSRSGSTADVTSCCCLVLHTPSFRVVGKVLLLCINEASRSVIIHHTVCLRGVRWMFRSRTGRKERTDLRRVSS
ncbi:hypothetical protein QBC47DRAFT_187855 [Echria macrotheca]|uniref:Uncharacterized protein n=1 Tax=Echria macrotheca TaxID=438768 RepID=A0AAJ0BE23_9PEZI|nr:hypothetical protein QBC47DRAFT_187855 [Echria macrotheca]